MKIFNTQIGINDIQQIIHFFPNNEKTKIVQYSPEGIYIEFIDLKINDKFSLLKSDFSRVNKIMGNDYEVNEFKKYVEFKSGKTKIKLNKVEFLITKEFSIDKNGFSDIDQKFIKKIKEASKFTSGDLSKVMSYVNCENGFIYAGDGAKVVKMDSGLPKDINTLMHRDIFKTFDNPVKIKISNKNIVLSNNDYSKVAIIKSLDDKYPDINQAFEKFANMSNSNPVDYDHEGLEKAIKNIIQMGHDRLVLSKNKISSFGDLNKYEEDIKFNFDTELIFYTKIILPIVSKGKLGIGNNISFVVFGENFTKFAMSIRN